MTRITTAFGFRSTAAEVAQGIDFSGKRVIVTVSSTAHLLSPVVFDDIHFAFRRYDPWLAYGQSKTANVPFAVGATARWANDGITANALNPGAIATNLQRHVGGKLVTPHELQKTREQGAATSVLLATSPLLEGVGGRYFSDCNESERVTHRPADCSGVAAYALDPANADRLWEESSRHFAVGALILAFHFVGRIFAWLTHHSFPTGSVWIGARQREGRLRPSRRPA